MLRILNHHVLFIAPDEGDDYTVMSDSTTFGSGATNGDTACISIDIVDDDDFEGDHDFLVQILSISPSIASGGGSLATVTIQDNNGKLCC